MLQSPRVYLFHVRRFALQNHLSVVKVEALPRDGENQDETGYDYV